MAKKTMLKMLGKRKIAAKKTEPEKPKYVQHNGMNLLDGDEALLLAEGCKLDKEKKAAEKRLKEIKKTLGEHGKGDFTNKAGDVLKISVTPKKSDIDPHKLHTMLTKKKMLSKFWGCVKVQMTPLKKVVPQTVIDKMHYDLDDVVKCSFK